ncbi:hypothetical protein HaLaN_24656 [Haematococcus lacustris]|uniref:Uncharacterized protein n=1 Tax=Haematococcus lacustris TaxID=44745 RepID=A0A699ZWY5_HAELA|nr:hypothetical protein HaLaN_24656 [Haematococcus lacustris]
MAAAADNKALEEVAVDMINFLARCGPRNQDATGLATMNDPWRDVCCGFCVAKTVVPCDMATQSNTEAIVDNEVPPTRFPKAAQVEQHRRILEHAAGFLRPCLEKGTSRGQVHLTHAQRLPVIVVHRTIFQAEMAATAEITRGYTARHHTGAKAFQRGVTKVGVGIDAGQRRTH